MQQTHTDDVLNMMENMTQELLLSVRDLQTHFPLDEGNVVALDGVDLDIKRGKTLAVVGESGCGKTTAARCIVHLDTLTSGKIFLSGTYDELYEEEKVREMYLGEGKYVRRARLWRS